MLYDEYQNRILKIVAFKEKIKKNKWKIISVCSVICLLVIAFLVTNGMMTSDLTCVESITYGDKLEYRVDTLFTPASYEFMVDGEWSEKVPSKPGEYKIRAVATRTFGSKEYSNVLDFSIQKKDLSISLNSSTITYGDDPEYLPNGLAGEDVLDSYEWELSDINVGERVLTLDINSISIKNSSGEDATNCYNISSSSLTQNVTIKKRAVTIIGEDRSKVYDGKPLKGETAKLNRGSFAYEDGLSNYSLNGEIVNAGKTYFTVDDVKIVSGAGEDVTNNYKVSTSRGALTVTKRKVSINLSFGRDYNGSGILTEKFSYNQNTENTLVGEHQFVFTTNGKNAGKYDKNKIGFNIYSTSENVTQNYSVTITGALEIYKKKVDVYFDYQKEYDGQTYTYAPSVTGMVFSETLSITSKSADAGEYNSLDDFTLSVIDAVGEEGKDNYEFNVLHLRLLVDKKSMSVQAIGASKMYDGTALTATEYETNGIVDGQTESVKLSGSITKVGTTSAIVDSVVIKDGKTDVTHNYIITTYPNTLEITPRSLILTANARKEYDDTDVIENNEFSLQKEGDNLASGDIIQSYLVIGYNGKIDAGEYTCLNVPKSSIVIKNGQSEDVAFCYDIISIVGTLTIDKIELTFSSYGHRKTYDRNSIGVPSATLDSGKVLDHQHYVISGFTGYTKVGEHDNVFSVNILDNQTLQDKTHNYDITTNFGKIIIDPIKLTVELYDVSQTYNGEAVFPSTRYWISEGELLEGDVTESVYGFTYCDEDGVMVSEMVNAGKYTVNGHIYIYYTQGHVYADYYDVTVKGSVVIEKEEIVLHSMDGYIVSDSLTNLRETRCYISKGAMQGSDEILVAVTGLQQGKGSSTNTILSFTIRYGDGTEERIAVNGDGTYEATNYKVIIKQGTLTIA